MAPFPPAFCLPKQAQLHINIHIHSLRSSPLTTQLLIRLPDDLAARMRQRIAPRQRSAFVQRLIEDALKGETEENDPLYLIALAVEQDGAVAEDMATWDETSGDGLDESTPDDW